MRFRKFRKIPIIAVTFASLFTIAACDTGSQTTEVCGDDVEVATPVTDSFKLDLDYSTPNFVDATSGIAITTATPVTYTDGDTVSFDVAEDTDFPIRIRFLGVNTPESTGAIQPWGIKASHFTKSKLRGATEVVLVNDITQYGKYDNTSSQRSLGFVWYRPGENEDFRCLNLELVEQGYSTNQLAQYSSNLPTYYDAFKQAGDNAKAAGLRVNGQNDCDFDSSGEVVETTIANAKENFDELGVQDDTANSGKKLRITAQIIAKSGYNFYCRDLFQAEDDEIKSSIYAFTQYKSIDLEVGYVVQFYCKITKYYGNYQLTDIETNTQNNLYPFKYIARTQEECEALGYDYNVEPYYVDPTTINSDDDLIPYEGNLLKMTLKINDREDFYRVSQTASGDTVYTIYTTCNGHDLEIRLQNHSFFTSESTIKSVFEPGKKYDVTCLLDAFQYEGEEKGYQLTIPGFRASQLLTYISEHIENN